MRKLFAGLIFAALAGAAAAESSEVNIAQQFGVSFLPLMVMSATS